MGWLGPWRRGGSFLRFCKHNPIDISRQDPGGNSNSFAVTSPRVYSSMRFASAMPGRLPCRILERCCLFIPNSLQKAVCVISAFSSQRCSFIVSPYFSVLGGMPYSIPQVAFLRNVINLHSFFSLLLRLNATQCYIVGYQRADSSLGDRPTKVG